MVTILYLVDCSTRSYNRNPQFTLFVDLIKLVPTLPNAQPVGPVDHYCTIPKRSLDMPVYHHQQTVIPPSNLTPTMKRRVIIPDQPVNLTPTMSRRGVIQQPANLTPTMGRRVMVPKQASNLTPTLSRRVMVPQQEPPQVFNNNQVQGLMIYFS